MWQKKKRLHSKRKHYSVIAKLEREGKITEQFQILMNNLTLEDVIAVKLELAAKSSGGNIFGIPVWHSIIDICRDAMLKFAISATRTKMEAARFLGINIDTLNKYLKKYKVKSYFEEEEQELENVTVNKPHVDSA